MKQTIIAIFLSTFLFANEQIPANRKKKPILLKKRVYSYCFKRCNQWFNFI
ncbi:MAG: hypothetical protein Ct9H300mP29_2210 [Candidatus Neomarinimicrobiota bacterium]|nr:MAG: hypothetical protein Ct9H300mP29_2210 [Candidatus Neomarinimicrobiota bacterium]